MPAIAMDQHKHALNRKITPKQTTSVFDKSYAIHQRKAEQQLQKGKSRHGAEACDGALCCIATTACVAGAVFSLAFLMALRGNPDSTARVTVSGNWKQ